MKDTGKSSSRKLRYVIYYTLYRMDPQKTYYKNMCVVKISKIKSWGKSVYQKVALCYLLHFTHDEKRTIKICFHEEIYQKRKSWEKSVCQKVALCYLLHVVQNSSSKHMLKQPCLHINLNNPKHTQPGFHLGAPKNA